MLQSFLKPLYHDLKTLVFDTLFPIYCLACEKENKKFICDDCQGKLAPLSHQFCIVCQKMSLGGLTHPKCLSPHTADGLVSIFDYHDPRVADILIKGKYSFLPDVYKLLGAMVANAVKTNFPHLNATTYTLTAIPLHKWRQRWRGFNQSAVLAEATAQNLGFAATNVSSSAKATADSLLVRCKFTRTQKNLKKDERIKNLETAFALKPSADVHNQSLILIDDVTTTGSTLLEAAKVLKRNGAKKVFCLTVARD